MSKYFIFSRIPEHYHNRWCVGRLYPIQSCYPKNLLSTYLVEDNRGFTDWFSKNFQSENWAYEIVEGPKEITQKDIEELL